MLDYNTLNGLVEAFKKNGIKNIQLESGSTIEVKEGALLVNGNRIPNIMEEIRDASGNLRFVEGNCTLETISGVTISYNKWSLSGTHLMITLSGTIENNTVIGNNLIATVKYPSYIFDKIVTVILSRVDIKTILLIDSNLSTQTTQVRLNKNEVNGNIEIYFTPITLTSNKNFRIQFDLLIDSE